MADFWKNYDNGKFSVGGKKDEEKKKSTSFWDEYDSGKYTVGGNRGSNDIKKLEELLAEKGLGRTAYRLPESLSKPAADTRNESQKQYDEYLGTLRSSADIQKELNAVGDVLKIERDKRRSYVRNQLRDGNDITMASGKPQANAELDSRISKLQNRYSELEQELKSNTYANYERNRLADDFAENSKYRSTDNGGAHSRMDLFGDTLITGYGNWKSEIINRNPDALAALDKQPTLAALNERTAGAGLATGSSIDLASLTGNDYSWTQSMTDDQVSMYNYLANTKGTEAADEYLDYIRSDVYAADRARIESEAQAYANEHPVLASGKTVLQAPMKGIAYVGQTIDYLADGKIDENAPYNRYSYEPTAIRNAVQKQVEDRWGGVGSFLYGTGMSMADSLLRNAISGGAEWISLGLMGTGAAADTVLSAKERGLSDDQAFALGTVAGAAEILTEKASVDRLFSAIRDKNGWVGKNIKEVLLNLAGDTIAEGTEEAVSDVINCVADILAAGEKSEWETAIRTYREQNPGMTESDAFKYAFLDKMKEIGLDFLGGALSGSLMVTGASLTNTAITAAQQNREKSQGIELARQARKEAGTPGDIEFLPDNEGGFTLPTAAETMDTAEDTGEIRTGSEKQFNGTLPTAEESELESRIDAAETETEKTGLRYGVDQKEIDSAKRLSQATGMKISYFSQDAKNGTMDNGFYNPQTGEIQLNAKSKRKTAVTVAHELTHTFEGTDAYTALQEYAKGDTLRKGKDWASEQERIRGLYQRAGIDLPGESAIDAEITAQWMERNFGSERDIAEICRDNPSLAKKIRDGLDSVVLKLADLSGTHTLYEAEEIGNVLDAYDRMLQKYEEGTEGSLKTSRDAEADMPTDAGEAQKNFSTESVKSETAGEFYDRMRQAYENGEIDAEQWEDAQSIYDEWLSVGSGERTTVADEGPEGRIPAWFREKKEALENAITRKAGERELPQPETGTEANRQTAGDIREEQEVKTAPETMAAKAVREASESRESIVSSAKFKKWFGDSMVTEEDGSPKLMYHGTSNGGYEMFDAWGKSNYGLFGTGSYFTDNPDVAETYTKKGKGKDPQIYPVYLSIQNPIDMDAPADIEAWKKAMATSDERFMAEGIDGLTTNEDVYRAVEEQVEDFEVPKYEGAEIMRSLLEGMGYDGITHIGGGRVNADDPRHRVYIAFKGGQVKSAVQNNGDFSADDWNIHHSISRVTAGNADEVLAENGVTPIADDVAVKHSLSTWTETEKVNVRKALKEKGFESKDINKWISDMNTIAAIIGDDRARLDFEANPDQTFVKPNQEYRYTVDASTLCAKRLLYTGTFDAIQHALPNTVLNSDDVLALMNMMKDAGYEAPCSVCYVESRRRNTGRFAKKWLDSYNGDYKPRIDELTTVDGREKLEREHPQAYNDFMNAMNRIGTNNPKITQTRTEYRGEIRKFSDTLVENLNEAGGLRLQSFSDLETPHLLDMMQVVADMSARGLTSQAYTKIPAFARVFGGTGIKINLSLIADGNGFDENGNLAFSSREGMDIDEAMEIREKYGENVGTIIVGVNDKHILACMADDRIDFIIPFHKSGWGKALIAQMGMEAYMDYTRFQNEKDITTGKKVKENIQPLEYWDFGVSGKENAETYLRLCAEQGRIPKFSRFLQDNGDGSWSLQPDGSTDGYWKLLTDYRMYDNNGNGAPQQLVQPNFDMDAAREILSKYKGGANSLPVAQDIVNRFVAQKRGGVQHSVSDENETGPIYELPAKARSNALKIEAQLARRLDSALDLGLAGPNGGMTDALKQFRMEKVRPIVESFLRGDEPETAALWTEYSTDPLQQHAFDAAFEEAVPALERIRGYSERVRQEREASDKRNAELDAQIPTETEDLVKLAESVKQAKRNISTIRGRLMLTEQDQQTVRNLLSGEMTDSQVQSTSPENADQIIEAASAEREYRSAVAPWARYTQRLASRRRAEADKHLEDAAKWKDKTAGWKYDRETAERNIRDIVPDAATADALVRDYFRPVHTAEAKSTRFKNDYIRRVQDLKLGMKATGNNTASESYAVQYLGEAEDNIRYLKTIRSPKAVRDGHNLQEWQAEVEAFKADNPDMDWAKVNKGIQEFSTIYGELIGRMNGVLVENGYMPVNVRRGYFPHFNGGEDTIMARFGNLLGMKINTAALPTSINGLTAGFKPGKTWFGHAQERLGFQTTYDAVQGFQNYIGGVADVIHQTDNLRNLRALATQVRYRTSDEQIQNQIDEIMANDTLDEAERQTLVDALKQNGRYQLSNFVAWLDEYTNLLANKKSKFDRGVEDLMGRGFYAGMKNLEGRVAANMISANLGSALTNFIPLNQASAMLGDRNVLRGMYQTVRGYASDDGFRDRSDFLVNRRGTDPLYQKTSQKISEFLSTPMNLIDNFTSESIVRAAYNRYRNQGMDAEEAMTAADEFAAGVMADRSKGAQPVIFGSRNPLLKLFTQFQVEVNNEYSTIFKDIPRDYKDKAVWILLRYFLGAYLFNDLYEKVVGRRAALDPVDLINETVGGLTGYQAPNTVDLVGDLIGGEDIDWGSAEDREDPYQAVSEFLSDAAEELPFIGGVAGGGRIPISSALPDKDNMLKALLSTSWSPKKRLFTAGQEIGKSIGTYVIPPFAGGFGKKIAETAVNMARGGRYNVDKDGNDVLQYPYYTDDGAVGTALKSALFGPTATEGGQEWIESGFKSLSAEQTSDYQGLTNYGADQRRAYAVAQMPGSKKADKIAKYRASIDLVDSADDKDSVFEFMADGKDANKFRAAKQCAGLDAETYVGWLEFLPRYDADGNGSMTQAETITAIDDYARKVGLTYPERAALYQLQGTTWKENPYDNEVGAAIKAMLGK